MRRRCLGIAAALVSAALLSCGSDRPEQQLPTEVPTVDAEATATAVAFDRKLFLASEECQEARERIAGYDLPEPSGGEELGQPTWEERFLAVDKVVRARMVSITPELLTTGRGKIYPAIRMEFHALESFRGSFDTDYIMAWLVASHYYSSYRETRCVRLDEDISSLRPPYAHLDNREAILFLEEGHKLDWLGEYFSPTIGESTLRNNYFLARLPSAGVLPNLFEGEQWRWLPQREGDTFYDRKYLADGPEADETRDTVTTHRLREIRRKIDRDLRGHDLECVYQAYRQARNFGWSLEALVEDCAR